MYILGICIALVGVFLWGYAVYRYKKDKAFQANCKRGKAKVLGYTQDSENNVNGILVELLGPDADGKHYGCDFGSRKAIKKFTVGMEIDVDYAPEPSKFRRVQTVEYPPYGPKGQAIVLVISGVVLILFGIFWIVIYNSILA